MVYTSNYLSFMAKITMNTIKDTFLTYFKIFSTIYDLEYTYNANNLKINGYFNDILTGIILSL